VSFAPSSLSFLWGQVGTDAGGFIGDYGRKKIVPGDCRLPLVDGWRYGKEEGRGGVEISGRWEGLVLGFRIGGKPVERYWTVFAD